MDRVIGVAPSRRRGATTRAVGVREIATGVGLLTLRRPAGFLLVRALGDVMDLALLGTSLRGRSARRGRLVAATASVVGLMILDTLAGADIGLGGPSADVLEGEGRLERVTGVVTIGRPPPEVYRFFRDLRNAPRFMGGIRSVEPIDERRSRWSATLPGGGSAVWEAEIVDDRPGEGFAFRALGEAATALSGSVRVQRAPGDRGTIVRLTLASPSGGAIAAAFAKLLGPALEAQGEGRPPPPQADHGDRRGRPVGREHPPRPAPGPARRGEGARADR